MRYVWCIALALVLISPAFARQAQGPCYGPACCAPTPYGRGWAAPQGGYYVRRPGLLGWTWRGVFGGWYYIPGPAPSQK